MPVSDRPIRVVPLRPAERITAPAAAPPRLTYRGGALLTAVEVFTIFWGSAWQGSDVVDFMNGFFDYVLDSPLIRELAEYSTNDFQIGPGTRTGTSTIASDPPATLPDAAIQSFIQEQVSGGAIPPPDQNTLYVVFLPAGVTVELQGDSSCANFCGYHDAIDGATFYAVMPYPDCSGCEGGLSLEDALTTTTSHELCEAVTDPVPGEGWYDDANGEIGDICAWQTKQLNGYTVQLEWSNRAGRCV